MRQQIEDLVRAGKFGAARKLLAQLDLKRLARADAIACANLARRAEDARLSLKILSPIIRPQNHRRQVPPASPEEKIEYAASLRNLGALAEAIVILSGVDSAKTPQALLQLSLCRIAQWDYAAAIPLLRAFIASFEKPAYGQYVGKVNLLAALIYEDRWEEAAPLSEVLQSELGRPEFTLLRQRSLELAAQLAIARENWGEADRLLQNASALLDDARDSLYALLLDKWRAVLASRIRGLPVEDLLNVRERAASLRAWEVVRDCDYQAARLTRDRASLLRLYFGTPFTSYRERLRDLLGPQTVPETFQWTEGAALETQFDLRSASGHDPLNRRVSLEPGQSLHRLLISLSADFYKPAPLLSLFSFLFPGEFFNVEASPNRVHHLITRLRQWLEQSSLGARLEEHQGTYALRLEKTCGLIIPREFPPLSPRTLELEQLRALLKPAQGFTTREAMAATGASRSSVQRLLSWAAAEGHVKAEGHAGKSRYRWAA